MRLSVRVSRIYTHSGMVGLALLVASCGEAIAGGFGVEQSAYYQGMSFAGAAAGGESLTSLAWNPATAGFAGNGLSLEFELLRGPDVGQSHRLPIRRTNW